MIRWTSKDSIRKESLRFIRTRIRGNISVLNNKSLIKYHDNIYNYAKS